MPRGKSPTTREQRMKIWDVLRKRFRLNIAQIKNKQQLIKEIRKKYGLKKYEKAKGKQKSLLSLITRTDFWERSKEDYIIVRRKGKTYPRLKPVRWSEREVTLLRILSEQYKGKELVREFNRRNPIKRSYSSIMVKRSRLKR